MEENTNVIVTEEGTEVVDTNAEKDTKGGSFGGALVHTGLISGAVGLGLGISTIIGMKVGEAVCDYYDGWKEVHAKRKAEKKAKKQKKQAETKEAVTDEKKKVGRPKKSAN